MLKIIVKKKRKKIKQDRGRQKNGSEKFLTKKKIRRISDNSVDDEQLVLYETSDKEGGREGRK